MSDEAKSILEAAMKLSDAERLELALALNDSVPAIEDEDCLTEEELFAELERRRAESERDPSTMVPWEEVKRMLES
jgi:putative addiction module component (TIGR02574 family)